MSNRRSTSPSVSHSALQIHPCLFEYFHVVLLLVTMGNCVPVVTGKLKPPSLPCRHFSTLSFCILTLPTTSIKLHDINNHAACTKFLFSLCNWDVHLNRGVILWYIHFSSHADYHMVITHHHYHVIKPSLCTNVISFPF